MMNLSVNSKFLLFESFSASLKGSSWPTYLSIHKQAQELDFPLRQSPGVERSQTAPYYNMQPFAIDSTAGAFTLAENQFLSLFVYMSCEGPFKATKKSCKNQKLGIYG